MINLFIYIILFFLELIALLIGLMWTANPQLSQSPYAGWVLLAGSSLMLCFTLIRIIRWIRQRREESAEMEAEKGNSFQLIWQDGTRKVILTEGHLRVGETQFSFGDWHQKLIDIIWGGTGESISFQFKSAAVSSRVDVTLAVPLEKRDELNHAVQMLRSRYNL